MFLQPPVINIYQYIVQQSIQLGFLYLLCEKVTYYILQRIFCKPQRRLYNQQNVLDVYYTPLHRLHSILHRLHTVHLQIANLLHIVRYIAYKYQHNPCTTLRIRCVLLFPNNLHNTFHRLKHRLRRHQYNFDNLSCSFN